MRAVSNTSPLSALALIGRIALLRNQFEEVWIPPAVASELNQHPDPNALAEIQSALQTHVLRVSKPVSSQMLTLLSENLHRGEAQAIVLAAEMKADILLMDEREGRRSASRLGLFTTGVLGILLRAKLHGGIPALRPEIQLLRSRARFFVSDRLEAKLLAAADE